MKKSMIFVGMILVVVLCTIGIMSKKAEPTTITTLSIREISEKSKEEAICYLTVILEDHFVEEYSLDYNTLKLKAEETVYDKVIVNSGFTGATIEIPGTKISGEFGMMLKEKNTEQWIIISVTTKDNKGIQ